MPVGRWWWWWVWWFLVVVVVLRPRRWWWFCVHVDASGEKGPKDAGQRMYPPANTGR